MQAAGQVETGESESIVKAILKREELGSTGIGRGVAVPHTKHPSVDHLVGTVAVSRLGVDFASLDGEVVHLFFLLVSPPDRPGDHLRALENISRQLRDDTFCRFLKQAKTVEDIQTTIERSRQQSVRIMTLAMSETSSNPHCGGHRSGGRACPHRRCHRRGRAPRRSRR